MLRHAYNLGKFVRLKMYQVKRSWGTIYHFISADKQFTSLTNSLVSPELGLDYAHLGR